MNRLPGPSGFINFFVNKRVETVDYIGGLLLVTEAPIPTYEKLGFISISIEGVEEYTAIEQGIGDALVGTSYHGLLFGLARSARLYD